VRNQLVILVALALISACGDDDGSASAPDGGAGKAGSSGGKAGSGGRSDTLADAVASYSDIVLASYEDTFDAAKELDAKVNALLDDPSAGALDAAREAWRAAREPYLQTEAVRFYDGPIDDPDDGPEGLINSWPLDEAYVDYVAGDDDAGIINDPSETIDADTLAGLNEQGGEKNIATGYHAIEFLLWGQDHSDTGPGDRPYTDFVAGGTAKNQERRGEYLRVTSGMLVSELGDLVAAWKKGDGQNYRAELAAVKPTEALRRILTGLTVLSGFETGGERLQTAYDTGDQEDEHSCFSDNTDRDMVQDVRGIQNVWLGRYERTDGSVVEGTSIEQAVAQKDEQLAGDVAERMAQSLELAEQLKPPFDREIAFGNDAGRQRVLDLIESLSAQEKLLMGVFTAFQLQVQLPEE
jgi:putative iron-regulated protein